ncbi:Thioredoxin-1 [Anaerobiospirillum thomasii]|uniref:Thioredoxin n=1 Tax=Anaerobiospirillum thomasii TaxID=179995 RepID=A0A2X0VIH4_9GAMM|nr:thioredoxin [Anaerobiospirillum thomasii]SPT69268.1 Thioredoxin-1 [Anaerobiospirillum thomasii]SPT72167.1 Thioredoxin-1 [Anaerobiospirillum thomasii]
MSEKVLHLNDDQFEAEVLLSTTPVLVDFWAPWCGPCKMIGPILEEIANETDAIKIVKINIDENSAWASKLGVMSIPTLIIYNNGEQVAKQIGALSKAELSNFINNHI